MPGAGLILAAPASGSGKTLVAAGLLRYLRDRGVRIAAAKAGPDYIDPTFHALAAGRPCLNLDPWAMRRETLAGLAAELESEAELVLCEGVMGLFDGTGPDGETGSTAELARLTGWPVVLVADARGQGASVAALVAGFARHDSSVSIAGVILNRIAGARHRDLLEGALARHLPDLPCLGAIPADRQLALPGRHLGLVPAAELHEAQATIAHAACAVGETVALDRLVALARVSNFGGLVQRLPQRRLDPTALLKIPSPPPRARGGVRERATDLPGTSSPGSPRNGAAGAGCPGVATRSCNAGEGPGAGRAAPLAPLGQRIAVARDDAFPFAYPAVLEGWRRQGASLSFFSPLADEPPDSAADAVYLPGGYPELHGRRLAAAEHCLAGLRRAAAAGAAIYGECGGYMLLGESLTDAEGVAHRLAGLLPLETSFAERRLHLGYRAARLLSDTPLGQCGARFRGHEFHYATTVRAGETEPLFDLADSCGVDLGSGGMRRGAVFGSFIHLIDRDGD